MKTLRECWDATGQRSDKGPVCHSYLPYYEELLGPFRDKARAILEVGIFHGASMDMWRMYFAPECHIWGVDFNPHVLPDQIEVYESMNVHLLLRADGYLPSTISWFAKDLARRLHADGHGFDGFDVIIDDGSHIEEHQLFVLHEYGELLNPGGVMIIEDVQANPPNGHPDLPGNLVAEMKYVDYDFQSVQLIDRRNEPPYRYDDLLVVIRK